MKVLVWKGPSVMEIEESPVPAVGPGWVVLKVEYAGICGSEIGAFLGHNELRRPPLIMGHEFSGVVFEAGPNVPKDLPGKLVAVNPLLSCGQCRACKRGMRQLCGSRKIIGVDYPGSYAEYVAVPASSCYPIKDAVLGSLVEPLACGVRATTLSEIEPGDSVMVIGAGTLGLMATRLAIARGSGSCMVVDTNGDRLRWATNWGANAVLNPKSDDVPGFVKSSTSGEGVDCVIDAVGSSQTRSQALGAIRRGGKVVLIGLNENMTNLPGNEIVRFEKQLIGSFAYSDEDFRRAVALADGGFIETKSGWLDIRGLDKGQASFKEQSLSSAPFSKILLRPWNS